MRRLLGATVLAWLVLVTPGVAAAAPRLVVGPVRGSPPAALPTQLAEALCGPFECVLWPEVSTQGRPDLEKVRRLAVDGVLTGRVSPGQGGRSATFALLERAPGPAPAWSFPLTSAGLLSPEDLRALERDLRRRLQPPVPPEPPRRPGPQGSASRPPGPLAAEVPALAAEPATRASAPAASEAPIAAVAPPARREVPARLAVEAGLFLARRGLSYRGVSPMPGDLLALDAPFITGPSLHLEAVPAAGAASPLLAGVGAFADWATSVGLTTTSPSGESRSTTFSRLQVGATWRSPPLGASRVVLAPRLAWQAVTYAAHPTIAGLADAHLSGVAAGLGAEAELGAVRLLAGAGAVRWTTARDLIRGTPPYFPGGEAWALEAELGAGLSLWGPLSLRVVCDLSTTWYALEADGTGTYAATQAVDRRLGVRAQLRGAY